VDIADCVAVTGTYLHKPSSRMGFPILVISLLMHSELAAKGIGEIKNLDRLTDLNGEIDITEIAHELVFESQNSKYFEV